MRAHGVAWCLGVRPNKRDKEDRKIIYILFMARRKIANPMLIVVSLSQLCVMDAEDRPLWAQEAEHCNDAHCAPLSWQEQKAKVPVDLVRWQEVDALYSPVPNVNRPPCDHFARSGCSIDCHRNPWEDAIE